MEKILSFFGTIPSYTAIKGASGPVWSNVFYIDETFPKNRRLVHLLESTYLEAYIGIRLTYAFLGVLAK